MTTQTFAATSGSDANPESEPRLLTAVVFVSIVGEAGLGCVVDRDCEVALGFEDDNDGGGLA